MLAMADNTHQKLDELAAKLAKMQAKQPAAEENTGDGARYAEAHRIAIDLIGGPIFGAFLGYWVDQFFSTTPLFLITFMILGFVSGIWAVYKRGQGYGETMGMRKSDNHLVPEKDVAKDAEKQDS